MQPQPARQHQPQHRTRLGIVGQVLPGRRIDQSVEIGGPAQRLGSQRAGQRAIGLGQTGQCVIGRLVERVAAAQHTVGHAERGAARG